MSGSAEAILASCLPRMRGLVSASIDLPPALIEKMERAYAVMVHAVYETLMVPGGLAEDRAEAIQRLGLEASRLLSWDVIDELDACFMEAVVEAAAEAGGTDLGRVTRAAVTVSNHFYDGFFAFNSQEAVEQALRLGSLIEYFPSPTFMLNEYGAITFANAAFRREIDVASVDGVKLQNLVISDEPILDLPTARVAVRNRHGALSHHLLRLSRIETGDAVEFFGQLIDRTDEVRLEHTKEQIISTISHELRTPLTAVVGYAELLDDALGDRSTGLSPSEAVEIIREQASHLLSLVGNLVDFARLDTGRIRLEPAEIELRSVVEAVLRRVPLGDHQTVRVRVPHRLDVWADRTRLEQLMTNLLTNAVRYGGPEIVVEAWRSGPATLLFRFADNGDGIETPDRERVFDTFYQSERAHVGVGTGLGLAICRAIVEAHGGTIEIEDRAGASFIIELPATHDAEELLGRPEELRHRVPGTGQSIPASRAVATLDGSGGSPLGGT